MQNVTQKLPHDLAKNLIRHPLEEICRKGATEMLQMALEVEVDLFLEKYQYVLDDRANRKVIRNGHHKERMIQTGAGSVSIRVPRIDDRALNDQKEPRFRSSLVPPYLRRANNIDEFIPLLYLKGISTGDFQEVLEKILGKKAPGLSPQNIVRLKQVWQKEYEQWQKRDLRNKEYVYWWVDGIYFNVRLDDDRQCLLVIIGATPDGKKEVVSVMDGFRESKESWLFVLRQLKRRGLQAGPKLAIGDGALGFWSALEEEYPVTDQQLCWVHKTANVLDKLPKSQQARAKTMIHDIYLAGTKEEANKAFDDFIETFEAKYLRAVDCLRNHREQLMAFYQYPAEHWSHIRSTNVIESTFATVRHRTKRTKGCGSRIATLTMVYKLLESAAKSWRRLRSHKKAKLVWEGIIFEDGLLVEPKSAPVLATA